MKHRTFLGVLVFTGLFCKEVLKGVTVTNWQSRGMTDVADHFRLDIDMLKIKLFQE